MILHYTITEAESLCCCPVVLHCFCDAGSITYTVELQTDGGAWTFRKKFDVIDCYHEFPVLWCADILAVFGENIRKP